jgi:hypothetical protein
MRAWRWGAWIGGVAALGGLVYGWGNGLFFPCGSIDRYLRLSNCAVIGHWDETMVEALVAAGDAGFTIVTRQPGNDAQDPQHFIDLALDGTQSALRQIAATAPADAWMQAMPSPDGKSILASIWEQGVWLIDRETGERQVRYEGQYSLGPFGFDANGDVLIDNGSAGSFDRPVEPTVLRFAADGTAKGEVKGGAAWRIYTTGISSAATADGALMFQHERTRHDTNIVALRAIEPAFATWGGSLLVAPIGGWIDQILPLISVSPDGKYVAASFDNPDEWGQVNSALAVWELETRELLTLVPTWRAEWENIVWLPDGQLAASRFNIDWNDSEVAVIRYLRQRTGGA